MRERKDNEAGRIGGEGKGRGVICLVLILPLVTGLHFISFINRNSDNVCIIPFIRLRADLNSTYSSITNLCLDYIQQRTMSIHFLSIPLSNNL